MNIWMCDLTYDQPVLAADTMPLSIASVSSYLLDKSKYRHNLSIFKYPTSLVAAMESGELPDLVAFSNFIWNSHLSTLFSMKIRKLKSDCIVVFGGIHYPLDKPSQEKWLREHPTVDFYVYKEAEIGFLNLVDVIEATGKSLRTAKESNIDGVHYIKPDNSVHLPPAAPRVLNLSSFPSPYLSGLMDKFFDGKLMPLITTKRGCPFTCTFCSEGLPYYGTIARNSIGRLREEIQYIAKQIADLGDKYARRDVYITDSNFGMYKEDLNVCEALAETIAEYNWPEYINATTGKNQQERVLKAAAIVSGRIRLCGAVQTLDPTVQKNIKRDNIHATALMQLALSGTASNAHTYSEIILGLPGDSLKSHEESFGKIVNAKFDWIQPFQLILFPNSEVSGSQTRKHFQLNTKYRVLTRSYGIYSFEDGTLMPSAEIEEVCVGGKYLPFEDYLRARQLHLINTVFYNDRFFKGYLKILDDFDIPRYDWVRRIYQRIQDHGVLNDIIQQFLNDSKEELWEEEGALRKYVSDKAVVERLIDGSLGANILGKYRIILVTTYLSEVCELARDALYSVLEDRIGNIGSNMTEFIKDLALFEYEQKRGVLSRVVDDTEAEISYDILQFINSETPKSLDQYRLLDKRKVLFYRSEKVKILIERNYHMFGGTRSGIYKQTTRTPIKTLYREVRYL